MTRRLVAMGLGALLVAVGGSRSFADTVGYEQALNNWSIVLERHVDRQGRVDFKGIRAAPEHLDEYLNYIAEFGPLASPKEFSTRNQRLAYYLNAYNALAMRKIVDFGIPDEITGLLKLHFFLFSRVRVSGKRMSLYTFENKYIRTENDPRIHFVLNCMAVSCPRLRQEALTVESLDVVLDDMAREFFSQQSNLRVDEKRETIHVSEILDFYKEDFLKHAPSLIDYLKQYVERQLPAGYSIEFNDYDWRVNMQPGSGGGWFPRRVGQLRRFLPIRFRKVAVDGMQSDDVAS